MSGHMFFKERWYGFDDAMYAGARLLEILSREHDVSAVLENLPDAVSTPELQVKTAEGENYTLIDKLKETATLRRRERAHHDRRPARRVRGRLRPRAAVEHHAGDRAALRSRQRGGARAHPGRFQESAAGGEAGRAAAVLIADVRLIAVPQESSSWRTPGSIFSLLLPPSYLPLWGRGYWFSPE